MMMMGPSKSKIASIIVGKMEKPEAVESGPGDTISDSSMAKEDAMKKFGMCLGEKDWNGCAQALQDFIYLVDSEDEPEPEYSGE